MTAAFAGSLAAVALTALSDDMTLILGTCAALTWVLRAGSIAFGWRLPVYRARPPKS